MLTPDTAEKLRRGLALLRAQQAAGLAPPPGEVSQALLAELSGVSRDTVDRFERQLKAKLAARLLAVAADDLSPRIAAHLRQHIAQP